MKKVLVLGDGQLGLMLAAAASRLGVVLERVSLDGDCLYRGTSAVGERLPSDWDPSTYDLVTAEREHLGEGGLVDRVCAHAGFRNAAAIATLADRRSQKAMLDRLGIATARWRVLFTGHDLARLLAELGSPVIVKLAQGGYDGRGQWRILDARSPRPPRELFGRLIGERAVAFSRELSLVGARAEGGRCVFYPLVENHHADGMLRCTVAPAAVSPALQRTAERMLAAIMHHLDYVGVMAMELFEERGELLVNELAPRVHNSGHWTLDGSSVDQFELHLRALCGWPLPQPSSEGLTVMLNLVGTEFDPAWLAHQGVRLHWYGKPWRAGRKLGHLNLRASYASELAGRLRDLSPALDCSHHEAASAAIAILSGDNRQSPDAHGSYPPLVALRPTG